MVLNRQSMTPIDLQELDDHYVVYVYTDQCSQDRLSITVQDNRLVIKTRERDLSHENPTSTDWYSGFSFCFLLPAAADGATAFAYRQNGLLRIIIKKRFI